MKMLVIGDTHFHNAYPSFDYLGRQFDTIEKIIRTESPEFVVFLGDIFHFRKPDPETVVRVHTFFAGLSHSVPGLSSMILIRGNHDTASKSDEKVLTMLEILGSKYGKSKVIVVKEPTVFNYDLNTECHFIPHYDNEEVLLKHLNDIDPLIGKEHIFVFGHFGFRGCINPNGDEDCPLSLNVFKYKTFLGHIHKPQDEGNVHVVGTPYSTAFSEADNKHRYAVIDLKTRDVEFKDIDFGVRYLQFDLASLEPNKEFIMNPNYTTILRVYLSHILDQNSVDLRKKIMDEYQVAYVDLKYLPLMDEDTGKSTYNPRNMIFEVNDQLIYNYLSEVKSDIPKEILLEGLNKLKE